MPSDHVIQLCTSDESVTRALAVAPQESVKKIVGQLFKGVKHESGSTNKKRTQDSQPTHTQEDLDRAAKCGRFPSRPSDLFLKMYSDVLELLEKDPMVGLVSPSLLGGAGVVPLTVVSVIPDIMRHYADLIVRAEKEVFLATNYWEPSHSASIVADSLRELSKRVGQRQGEKVVVKLMYDRGTPSQAINNHAVVKPDAWSKVGLPTEDEIPNIDFEVVNYHRPLLGTFHAKYMVVDRKVACLNSNNIQDRPNVEMMVHVEGPIVDSFYDMALLSWSNAMHPPLPLLNQPRTEVSNFKFNKDNEHLQYIDEEGSGEASRRFLQKQHEGIDQAEAEEGAQRAPGGGRIKNFARMATNQHDASGGAIGQDDALKEHPNMMVPSNSTDGQNGSVNATNASEPRDNDAPAQSTGGSQVDDQSNSLPDGDPVATKTNARPDVDDNAEADNVKNEIVAGGKAKSNRAAGIAAHLNAGNQDTEATAEDSDSLDDFKPHIMHQAHDMVPMAMVNRHPRGTPGHSDGHDVPQNVAFLAGFKYAQKSVFIQTPTFNASPVVPATLDACRRGIEVTLYLDLGFNDQGEMIPFQGGTNEEVVNKMYKTLNEEGKQDNLKVYWYTGKDQVKPLNAAAKKRNCHVKFMSIDDSVAILGNGNQDTQSWFHSQEINLMIDSKDLVAEWHRGINANQNTSVYGLVDNKDGIWRDKDGTAIEASGTKNVGPLGRLKGLGGAVARVRGTGGF
ncbi:hypothetical protein SISSUDRAFT_1009878, partial [Sistotremastrum suecicum HHB10207 ss-3]